jgi:peptide/nickel transport system substrate-binding protein
MTPERVLKAASGGTLVFGGGQDAQSFNIILFPKSMCTCNSLISSTLFKLNATGTDVEGDLVERWDIQPDGHVYVLHLRPDAVWHDGQPVTAGDVVFTMQALRDPKTGSTYVAFLDGIDQFTVDGPQTVRLTLKQPVPALLSRLSRVGVLPKHLLVDEPNVASSTFNQHPVGSGPFKFESYTPGVQRTLVRNDQYYLGPPRLDRVVYRFSTDLNVAALQLKTGEVQLAQLASANVPSLADAPDVSVDQFPPMARAAFSSTSGVHSSAR